MHARGGTHAPRSGARRARPSFEGLTFFAGPAGSDAVASAIAELPNPDATALMTYLHALYLNIFNLADPRYTTGDGVLQPVIWDRLRQGLRLMGEARDRMVRDFAQVVTTSGVETGQASLSTADVQVLVARTGVSTAMDLSIVQHVLAAYGDRPITADGVAVYAPCVTGHLRPLQIGPNTSVALDSNSPLIAASPYWRWLSAVFLGARSLPGCDVSDIMQAVAATAIPLNPLALTRVDPHLEGVGVPFPNFVSLALFELVLGRQPGARLRMRSPTGYLASMRAKFFGTGDFGMAGLDLAKAFVAACNARYTPVPDDQPLSGLIEWIHSEAHQKRRCFGTAIGRLQSSHMLAGLEALDETDPNRDEEDEEEFPEDDLDDLPEDDEGEADPEATEADADDTLGTPVETPADATLDPAGGAPGDDGGDFDAMGDFGGDAGGGPDAFGDPANSPEDNNSMTAAPTPAVDNTMSLIPLVSSGETTDDFLYRQAVEALCRALDSNPDYGVESSTLDVLREWCTRWLYLSAVSATRELIDNLDLRNVLRRFAETPK